MQVNNCFNCHEPQAAERYRATGAWKDKTLVDFIKAEIALDPNRAVIVENDKILTITALFDKALRLASWLHGQGIQKGDVVSYQLPNWSEVLIIDTAASVIGAISNPIGTIYRDAEVGFILRDAKTKAIFIPNTFRGFDYGDMIERIRCDLPDLLLSVTVRGQGHHCYEEIIASASANHELRATTADDPRLLMYTSGTTGRAKGVLHSYNTLGSEVHTSAETWKLGRGDVMLMPSPLTHITGYLYGMGFPVMLGMSAVLMEKWDACEALRLIERHSVSGMVAATPFLTELTNAAIDGKRRVPSLRIFACGGAPVPPEIVRRATEAFENCAAFRVYGSTEAPTVTLGTLERGSSVAGETDGYIVGHEVKIVDPQGHALPAGEEGEILTRGPEVMLGYSRPEDNEDAFDEDGFFRTGDLGYLREDGALVISGRQKDLIIRGGENLSAKEIEDILYEYNGLQEVAVVAMPHPRLGEGVCAFVIPAPGKTPTLAEITAFLDGRGLAKQKFPERLEIVSSLPRTPSGKIQKYILRREIADKVLETLSGSDYVQFTADRAGT